jgi:hypothetical protein
MRPVPEITLEQLRERRSVDVETAEALVKLGWRQAGPLEGLLWCSFCSQPTIWKDQAGRPAHLWCADAGKE